MIKNELTDFWCGLAKSGAISANTAVLLAFPVLIAALVVLFLKRKDI